MVRIFVFSLLLANILLIAMRLLQPDSGNSAAPVRVEFPSKKLPTIELAENLPETEMTGEASASGLPAPASGEAESVSPELGWTPTPVELQPMSCIQVGPFEDEASMAELKAELTTLFDRVQSRERRSIVDKGYWVFLPKYSTRAEAEQANKDLAAAGVREFYIMPDGAMANAISLGVYERLDRAEERRQQLNDLGLTLDVMIEPQTEIQTRYWMEAGPVNALNPTLIELSYNNPDVTQTQVDCSSGDSRSETGVALEDLAAGAVSDDEASEQN